MALAPGTRVGPYEIAATIGAGGMGEVYRARDPRLRRDVAVKVLPAVFTADPERLARFEREAQLLAQLHHPNIAAIFGLEQADGVRALVMELVEGEDLATMLARGPLPVEETVAIARQIAEALEAAHERGIVHRDLKPANVKMAADGTVKVLDFGLARAIDVGRPGSAAGPELANSPTLTAAPGTQLGMILGTAAYMSPEQARGGVVDRRADVWALGVVLFEMLTGRRLFAGETVSDTLAAVLREEIDFGALPAEVPPELRRLLRRCLERNPKNRLHDIADARIMLDEIAAGRSGEDATPRAAAASPPAWRRLVPWAVAGLGLTLGIAGLIRSGARPPAAASANLSRFVVPPPAPGDIIGYPALSPDGRSLAFVFAPEQRVARLWLHSFASGESRELAGTHHAEQPFWSPDGRHVGFFARGQLRSLEVGSGHVEALASASDARGGTWTAGGEIIYSPTCCSELWRVSAGGAEARPLTALDPATGESSLRFPWALPGGALLYTVPDGKRPGMYWRSPPGEATLLQSDVARGVYDPRGYLFWVRDGALLARRFDPSTGTLSGEVLVVDAPVGTEPEKSGLDLFAVAGEAVAVRAAAPAPRELRWVDRHGTVLAPVSSPGNFYDPVLSPDGTRLVAARSPVPNFWRSDVWIYDASARDRATRLSFAGGRSPVWSADGTTIYYSAQRDGRTPVLARRADGSGDDEVVLSSPTAVYVDDASRREPLLAIEGSTGAVNKLWLLPLRGSRVPRPFHHGAPGSQSHATFSPDGRLLAYTSDESGQGQIYVQPVDGSPGRWQVTSDGGDLATWRADSKELYYVGSDRIVRAVPIRNLDPFAAGEPEPLFPLRIPQLAITGQHAYYQPSPDGQRFLVSVVEAGTDPGIRVTIGWAPPPAAGER